MVARGREPRWWVSFRWLMVVLLLISAALQLNDPDPLRWIAIYLGAALVTLVSEGRRHSALLCAAVAAVALVWAAILAPSVVGQVSIGQLFEPMEARGGAVERGRELGGLLIVAAWTAVLAWRSKRRIR